MEKLSMCRICLVQNVRMCVVTNKSLQEMYEKLTDVPFVTEDRKPMLACFFCCTRLKQCCQLQRKCVEAEELLAQMLSEGYVQKPLKNRGHLEFVGRFIITPIENISIVNDCQIESDAIKQELPAVCEEQDDVELQPAHLREVLDPDNMYNSHPDVKPHYSAESEVQLVMEVKIERNEEHELSENLRVRETEELELENPDKSYPRVEDIPAHASESDSEDDVPLSEITTEAEEGQEVPKRKRRAGVSQRAVVAKKPTLKRKLENTIPAKQTMNVLSDSIIIWKTETSASESVAMIKEPSTTTSQSSFNQSSNLIKHTRIHTSKKTFKCVICKCSFSNKSNLNNHFRIHTGEKPFKCDVCQKSFDRKSKLAVHFRKHSGEKPFKCNVCQRSYSQKSSLNAHSRLHTGEKPYQCDVCQRSFNFKGSFDIHSRTHTGEKPYQCNVCQRSFICKSRLNEHIKKHSDEKPFKCDICQRSFSNKNNLKVHSRIHTNEKLYKCDTCQRSFRSKSSFEIHFRKHSGENPFKCDVCQRSFSLKANLKIHSRIHTGEKPYQCDICQNSFRNRSNLITHFRKHSGEKPYKCDVCQRSFSLKKSLKIHSRTHTGEKPYQCDICQRNFSDKCGLNVHLKKNRCVLKRAATCVIFA